ncbi:DNA-binding response regulator [Marinicauda salina]|uniref:DNA-binding response regulator n=1 Tax=Marinicauda salina TaxID=2135793 RepID=A0A2U2BX00_9PROT|nr:response regulator [Marinicauda salina]PWE18510.1 DNA-binding response regulator [Marinicauda salina]
MISETVAGTVASARERAPAPRLYLVDDDPMVRESVEALFAAHDRAVATFSSIAGLLDSLEPDASGCLLLDIRMPGEDGVSAVPMLRERFPCLIIIMITAHADVDSAVRALKAGAVDFIRKPWRREVLFEAVDQALSRAGRLRTALDAHLTARKLMASLTPRERDVFEELITGAANKVVARRLNLSPRTVEFHRARIFEKTERKSAAELVRLKTDAERDPTAV